MLEVGQVRREINGNGKSFFTLSISNKSMSHVSEFFELEIDP